MGPVNVLAKFEVRGNTGYLKTLGSP